MSDIQFVHRYVPAGVDRPPLLLLHGTGGSEDDLIDFGKHIAPGAALISPRGQVWENGHARFFRRVAEGVFDVEDLHRRTHELAAFLTKARQTYALTNTRFVAVGFSNGANMSGSLLLLYPELFRAAVLLRPMVPFVPESMPDLSSVSVLITAGERDSLVPRQQTEHLAALLQQGGAQVEVNWQPGGHRLTEQDAAVAREWLGTL